LYIFYKYCNSTRLSRKKSLELIEVQYPASIKLVYFRFPLVITLHGSIRDDPYWTSRKKSLELIELSSINKVSLV
jgi:hypothetical protein